jgi:hypothetical protein
VVAFSERGHAQQPLPEQLQEHQRRYLEAMLTSSFNLGDILKKLGFARKDKGAGEFEDESMRNALDLLAARLEKEEGNTRTFQTQLLRLLRAGDNPVLLERIAKGGAYYSVLLLDCMKDLLQHIAQVEQLSRTKQYADDLRELDGLLMRQLGMIAKAGHIAQCILNGEEVRALPDLEKELKGKRQALIGEVAQWAQEHKPKAKGKSGRKRKRDEEESVFGGGGMSSVPADAFFGIRRREKRPKGEKPVKGDTYRKTFALLKEGKTVAEVAAERQLSVGTIEGHVAKGIAEGEVEIGTVMEEAVRNVIADWMREHPEGTTQDARNHFGETYSYGQLRMVQAWVRKE